MGNDEDENFWKFLDFYLTEKGYKQPIINLLRFVLHIVAVMVFMLCGALIFVALEDPEALKTSTETTAAPISAENEKIVNKSISATVANKEDLIMNRLETKYGIILEQSLRTELKIGLCNTRSTKSETEHHAADGIEDDMEMSEDSVLDKHFVFMKWFYFVTTCTTTIGYGHVHPKTDQGKLFYIFFSIIGIALMMTLLKKCGSIINGMNRKMICMVRHHMFRHKKYISDELLSVFCIIFMFIVFMLAVTWHDHSIKEASHWSNIDRLYFWIVTFTTVGFGDVHFSLTAEVEHVHELLVYRICGLSFLAAIIDSIQMYTKYRNKQLSIKLKKQSAQLLLKIRKRSDGRKSNNSSGSSKNSALRDLEGITEWQLDAMKNMSDKFSH